MLVRRSLVGCVAALLAVSISATSSVAARKAFHVTGHLDVVPDPVFGPYATSDFDAVFVYETELDHPPLTGPDDPPPATAHAVDATELLGSQFEGTDKRYLFKSYPVPDEHIPDPLGVPDPAGYNGISFIRAYTPDSLGGPEPEEVVYARSRRGNSSGRPPSAFEIKVADNASSIQFPVGYNPDLISIVDHIRVTNNNSIPGSLATESGRFSMFFAHHDGLLLTDTGSGIFPDTGNDLPPTLATSVLSPNGPWGFGAWEGTEAASLAGGQQIEIAELMFGDADLDGDVDGDDEAIFNTNLDNDRDGLADVGGAFVYEVDEIPDLVETMDVDETQQIGFATWLLGDFNLDGFVTDEDGIYFVPTLPGDGNGDGWVDGLDYLIWAGAFGTHPGPDGDPSDGDYNDDGWVDGLDYLEWAANFGSHSATAVPEASTLAMLWLAAAVGFFGRVRRRRAPRTTTG